MLNRKHCNIPIFIPQRACPHQCIYCNQRYISGQQTVPTLSEVDKIINQYLLTVEKGTHVQVAFFGGTFTGLDIEEQKAYLEIVKPYIVNGEIQSVRLSTRPDYINNEILDLLQQYHVTDIELGTQSLDDEVLLYSGRGHTCKDVERASNLIKSYGFNLGLQMMIGLPKDTLQKSILTAKKIISLGAASTRIYPTLVIDRTPLAVLYKQGKYKPLTIECAIDWTKEVYKIFQKENITVLRVGLHPSIDLMNGKGYLAGPFHVSFFELVLSALWKERFEQFFLNKNISQNQVVTEKSNIKNISVNPKDINYAIGYKSSNLNWLKSQGWRVKFIQNENIGRNTFEISE